MVNTQNICSDCTFASCAIYTLSNPELESMQSNRYQVKYDRGELLRKQFMPVDYIIYLRDGYVKEYLWHENQPDQVVQVIKPRTYIGLQGACTNTSSTFSYQAITPVDVCLIEKETFTHLIEGNGKFASEILKALSKESISNHKRFLSLNQTQIFGKVAGLLKYLSEDVYENRTFELHLKREELAQMVASTRESVTRAIKWFHNEGVIEMTRNHVQILQYERLVEMAKRG
jgi:CRP/FNR family transcriptional regulator